VRFEQRLGAQLPLATEFTDTVGNPHALSDYFGRRPVVLTFGYARCPQLCSVVADATVAAVRAIRPEVGRDFDVIAISVDPHETLAAAAARETDAIRRYGETRSRDGWHFLLATEPAIRAVADACGFRYTYDPRSRQYAHPSGFVVLTPDGRVSRYFLGLDFPPAEVAQALARAARGQTGPPALEVLLRCFRGGGIGGRYGAVIWRALQIAVAFTVIVLGVGTGRMLRDERRARVAKEAN
jgi:protein SCO1/2